MTVIGILLLLTVVQVDGTRVKEKREALVKRGPFAWGNASAVAAAALAAVGTTRLLLHAMSDDTFRDNAVADRKFLQDCRRHGISLESAREVDAALSQYMDAQ